MGRAFAKSGPKGGGKKEGGFRGGGEHKKKNVGSLMVELIGQERRKSSKR